MGRALGKVWARQGHELFFGSREKARGEAVAREIGDGVRGGLVRDSAEFCDVALLAIPWYAFTDIERLVENALDGKVVIDCINPLRSTGSLALGHKWSAGEEIQKTLYRSHVVKAFNHLYASTLDNPTYQDESASAFYCSNHDQAQAVVIQLASEMGLEPVDAGPIKNARLLEPLAALWMQLAFVTHHGVDTAFKLIRRSV